MVQGDNIHIFFSLQIFFLLLFVTAVILLWNVCVTMHTQTHTWYHTIHTLLVYVSVTHCFSSTWVVNLLQDKSDIPISLCLSFLSWQTYGEETGFLLSFSYHSKNISRLCGQENTTLSLYSHMKTSCRKCSFGYWFLHWRFMGSSLCLISFTAVLSTEKSPYMFDFQVEIRLFFWRLGSVDSSKLFVHVEWDIKFLQRLQRAMLTG